MVKVERVQKKDGHIVVAESDLYAQDRGGEAEVKLRPKKKLVEYL